MNVKHRKIYVYTVMCNNNKGFTLISTLLALMIIAMTIPLLAQILKAADMQDQYEGLSVQRFFSHMQDEAIKAQSWSVKDGTLTMHFPDGESASFARNGQHVVRRLRGGYEIYLFNVDQVEFDLLPYGISINITTLQGVQYAKTIVFY